MIYKDSKTSNLFRPDHFWHSRYRFKIRWYEQTACWLPSSWLILPNQTWQALYHSTLKLVSPLKLVITVLPQWHSCYARHWWHRREIANKVTNSIPFWLHTSPLEVFTSDSPWSDNTWYPWTSQFDEEHLNTPLNILAAHRRSQWGYKVNTPTVGYGLSWDANPSARLRGIPVKGHSWLACFDIFSL